MEWTIPIQKLEVNKIQVGQLQKSLKPLTPLSYADGPIVFQSLNLLLPPLVVKEYDSVSGKLLLNLNGDTQTTAKLMALQDSFLQNVFVNQKIWFPDSNRTKEQLNAFFQPFVENSTLHLYCPIQQSQVAVASGGRGQDMRKNMISIWKDNSWKQLTTTGLIVKGESIRVALRLQGISYQMNTNTGLWTGRFRVQHKICCIYQCVKPVVTEILSRPKPTSAEEQKC